MKRVMTLVLAAAALAACGDTDVANRGGELAPGQEVEDMGAELDVEAVEIDTMAWFTEGRTVTFNGRSWIIAGEPLYDPNVEYVGEFEGTPLYAEVGVMPPYDALFIPLEDDFWQMLEEGAAPPPGAGPDTAPEAGAAADTGLTELR